MTSLPTFAPDETKADAPPPRMESHEKARIRAAAFRATRLYPGPVGEFISRELLSFEAFGYRLAKDGATMRLVHHVMTAEQPR